MRVPQFGSFLLQIFAVGVCCFGVFATGELEANNVKYEFGARLPKRDLVSQANNQKPIYNIVPIQNYPVEQEPVAIKLEEKVDDILRHYAQIIAPQVLTTEQTTVPPQKQELSTVQYPRIVNTNTEVLKVELQKEEPPKPELQPIKKEIIETPAQPKPILTTSQVKRITKPRKLKKYPVHRSASYRRGGKYPADQPVTQKIKILQKPVAFSFAKTPENNKNQDNTVASSEHHVNPSVDSKAAGSTNKRSTLQAKGEPAGHSQFRKGGGSGQHSGHYSEKGNDGAKKYDGHDDYEKLEKGHHDKEGHKKEYIDDTGNKKHHNYDDGHHSGHHKAEKGEKKAEYEDHSKYSKGWSTKGEHKVHRLNDYDKKKVFYDDFHDEEDFEDESGYYDEKEYKGGGGNKGGRRSSGHHSDYYAKEGDHKKGGHYDDRKRHDDGDEHSKYYKSHSEGDNKRGEGGSKNWGSKHREGSGDKHPADHHSEPTRHVVWVGVRTDHDVADTRIVPTGIQESPKSVKTKRHHQRNAENGKKESLSQKVISGPVKRSAGSSVQVNINREDQQNKASPVYNSRYFFITYH